MPGDVPGSGSSQFVATSGIDSADKCAEYCDKEKNCGSYEFSPSELKCNVNTENEPTSKKIYKDYQFCSKKSKYPQIRSGKKIKSKYCVFQCRVGSNSASKILSSGDWSKLKKFLSVNSLSKKTMKYESHSVRDYECEAIFM